MKKEVKNNSKMRLKYLLEWFLHMLGYTFAFIISSSLFRSVEISGSYIYLMYFIIVCIIYFLNKTIKPILVTLTIPITGLTLGLFYPCINLFILKIVDWIMQDYFNLKNLVAAFFLAILLSIMNFVVEEIINKAIKKVKTHG